ncbi:aldolase catalytic domain-containing protein [uncultured Marinobacter sp.]|uniref:aldolase catalytic domain-containing protein n=1 Tax=uncultured Marinobacter sp. TaxID=187379 RepID=UPI0030C7B359
MMSDITFLDCTLRDGGYYNQWDFPEALVQDYLYAMRDAGVDVVELGFRSVANSSFKGACAFTTDSFLETLDIPEELTVGVMVNGSEVSDRESQLTVLEKLFPNSANESPVDVVRLACHVHEVSAALDAVRWLKTKGFYVGLNLMQIADREKHEVVELAREASASNLDVLYFADSMGSMDSEQTRKIVGWFREGWHGPLGIHTHDNLGRALENTLAAMADGVTWLDSTVTGMGRGPGNARTEELAIEMAEQRSKPVNLIALMKLVNQRFKPLQDRYGWGTNPYYYLAGKYGIHPSYIQEMLSDSRYGEEDVIAVLEHLRVEGGKKFSLNTLDAARHFYRGVPRGAWAPESLISGREVLILGSGPGVNGHQRALEAYIRAHRPLVFALNTQEGIAPSLIDARIACHPVRLLADCAAHMDLPHPLITPASMLPEDVRESLEGKELLDFGLSVEESNFDFFENHCVAPTSLVIAYALSVVTSGNATRILLAGFDGYSADDPRSQEMHQLLSTYQGHDKALPLLAVTPTRYPLPSASIYALGE